MIDENNNKTIDGFGDEWTKFDQSKLKQDELDEISKRYFNIFPLNKISKKSVGFDLGCGSGRCSKYIASKVKSLHCIDPSNAIDVAKNNLKGFDNCFFYQTTVENMDLEIDTMDFGFSLGVLHHTLDPQKGLSICSSKLKKNSPFLLYLYYSFDNKPLWFRLLWKISNYMRLFISIMPRPIKLIITDLLALLIYLPLARFSKIIERIFKINVNNFPLSAYRNLSYYTMRTDSLDRFGTRIEKRYSRKEIEEMLIKAGFYNIVFSDDIPYWCVICYKK